MNSHLTFTICMLMLKRCIMVDSCSVNLPLFTSWLRVLNVVEGGQRTQDFPVKMGRGLPIKGEEG